MRTTAIVLVAFNALLLIVNYILLALGKIEFKTFHFGSQLLIVVFIWVAFELMRKPEKIKWFGSRMDSNHSASITTSYFFSILTILLVTFFNTFPISVVTGFATAP